jgi:hypothetical protein
LWDRSISCQAEPRNQGKHSAFGNVSIYNMLQNFTNANEP